MNKKDAEIQLQNVSVRNVEIRDDAVNSSLLFGAAQRIWIDHKSERYELRVTKQGKLILTK